MLEMGYTTLYPIFLYGIMASKDEGELGIPLQTTPSPFCE